MAIVAKLPDLGFQRTVTREQVLVANDLLSLPVVPLETEVRVTFELWDGTRYLIWSTPCHLQDDPASIDLDTTCTVAFRGRTATTSANPDREFWSSRITNTDLIPEAPAATPCARVTWYERSLPHTDAVANLALPFLGKPRVASFVLAHLLAIQELSEQAYDTRYASHVDYAIGIRLARLGRLVGQSKMNFDQETFRALIKARMAANRSSGGLEDLIAVAGACLRGEGQVQVSTLGPAAVQVVFEGTPDFTEVAAGSILPVTRAAGVAGTLITTDSPTWNDSDFGNAQDF